MYRLIKREVMLYFLMLDHAVLIDENFQNYNNKLKIFLQNFC